MVNPEVKTYVEENILPRYATFDKAHNVDHATTVIEESAALASHYAEVDPTMAYIIAAYHDTGLCEGRERHHIVSGEILRSDDFITSRYSEEQIQTMVEAIEDHRASSKNDPRSIYGRIVAEADRIISCEITLRRTVQYGLKQNPEATLEEHYARFRDHLQTKYAEGGYLRLYIPHSGNGARLAELRALISDEAALRERFFGIVNCELLSVKC